MNTRRAAVALLAGLLAAGCRKPAPLSPARQALDLLPLASHSDPLVDQDVVLTPAPLPAPCDYAERSVTLCAQPAPLQMLNTRYDALKAAWGQRQGPPAQIQKIIQTGPHDWSIVFYPDLEKPLAWFDPAHPAALVLWPVRPTVSQIQAPYSTLQPPQPVPEGPTTMRLQFDPGHFPPFAAYELRWVDPVVLNLRFRLPRKPFKVLIDPGHGGIDTGAEVEGIRESGLNLQASRALAQALKAQGVAADLARDSDAELPLDRRFKAAQEGAYDLALSIHHDAIPAGQADRPACFYGREDLFSLARELCAPLQGTSKRPSPSRRYLVLTQPTATPSLLLELLNMNDGLIQDPRAYEAFLRSWAKATAKKVREQLQKNP